MITNDTNVRLRQYCGDQLVGKALVVYGYYVVITFRSDYAKQHKGFHIFFTAVQHPGSGKC